MKGTRMVVLLGIVGLFVAALVFERDPTPPTAPLGVDLGRVVPTVPGSDALASTWFCAAGSASGPEGPAEQVLIISNDGDSPVEADLTVHTDTGEQVSHEVELGALSRTQVRVSDIVTAAWASVVVEAPGGGIAVDHLVSGPTGRAMGPCSSSVAPTWYLPVGTTSLGVQNRLAVFNPFAADAVVDITFETETDRRTPPEYEGLVIPAGHVRVLSIDEVVTVREQVATQVVARTGLVVAEQLEMVGDESDKPSATTILLGAPATAHTWHLPAGRPVGEDVGGRIVVFNPGDRDAEVDVQVLLDEPESHEPVEPFELTVFAGQFAEVDLGEAERMPEGVAWSAFVASRNDVAVVAASSTTAGGEAQPRGATNTLGSPVMAKEWRVPYGGAGGGGLAAVEVVNPTSEPRTVRLEAVASGAVASGEGDGAVVPPGGRIRLTAAGPVQDAGDSGEGGDDGEDGGDASGEDASGEDASGEDERDEDGEGTGEAEGSGDGGGAAEEAEGPEPGSTSWRVIADGGVVVARTSTFVDGAGFASAPALAVAGSLALAPAPSVDLTVDPSVALEGIVPEDGTDDTATDDPAVTDDTTAPESGDDGVTGDDGSDTTEATDPNGGDDGSTDAGGGGTAGGDGAGTGGADGGAGQPEGGGGG